MKGKQYKMAKSPSILPTRLTGALPSLPAREGGKEKGTKHLNSSARKRRMILGWIIGALGFLLYSNTFSNGYVLDDFSAVKENNIVRQGIHAIPEIFKTSYRQGYLSVKDGLYRPLSLATYAIEWNYFPDKPSISHFVNVVLYGLTGYLLFMMLCILFGPLPIALGTSQRAWAAGEIVAFITSLLFITHPLHVEVVANIKSRDEILCFLFVLISFIAVLKHLTEQKTPLLLLGLGSYFLSLLSKETSITFLALLPLALYLFSDASIKKIFSVTAIFLGVAMIYLFIRQSVLEGVMADDGVSVADNVIVGATTFGTHAGTAFYILGLYVKMLVYPHPLSYDYSFNQIPMVGMDTTFPIVSLLFYAGIAGYAGFILFNSVRKTREGVSPASKIMAFGIFFFLITMFLFSNLVLIIGTSMGDRLTYFPSLGFCIALGFLLTKYLRIEKLDIKLIPVLLIILLFSFKTYSRNADWKDNYTLYTHDVKLVPNSVKAHYYLGLELIKNIAEAEQDAEKKKKIYEEGILELERAVEILPSFASAYTQMGVAYYRLNNFEKAIDNYNKAEKLHPSDAITLNNIGSIYFEWKKYPEATEKFKNALQIDPRFIDAHMNLGSVYGTLGDYRNAIASFQNVLHYAPDNARAYYYIGITYQNMGDMVNADKYFEKAVKLDPKLPAPKR